MKPTINSTIWIRNEKKENIINTLNKFKAVQDIPFDEIDHRLIEGDCIELTIKYPLAVFDGSVTQFIAVLFGELPYMRGFGSLRFVDLELPDEVYSWFQGPQFGADGIKFRFGFDKFPFLMSIIKPSVDLSVDSTTQESKLRGPLEAGFHAVKDDEMLGNYSGCLTLADRLTLAVTNRGYVPALNLDSYDEFASALTDDRVMMAVLNASIIGFPLLNRLRKISRIPILSHLSLQGTFNQSFSPRLYAFLHRLFGCDAFITAIGEAGYYGASKQDEADMVDSLTKPLPIKATLPLLTGGARLQNLFELMSPYEEKSVPYGLVMGSFIFNSDESPKSMAQKVVQAIASAKRMH